MKAVIHVDDEVNVRIKGLELDHRKALVNQWKFENPAARHMPAVRLGRWDGKVAFFQLGGATYVNLLPEILPRLEEWGYDLELKDNRTYQTSFDLPKIDENVFSDTNWPEGHPHEGEPIVLRDYQVQALNTFFEDQQCLQEIATGAGKTIITAAMSKTVEKYGRTIVIVPNQSLIKQTEADYINLGLDVGVYYGGRKDYGRKHTICTWQSLNTMYKNTKNGEAGVPFHEFVNEVVCLIVDEAHGAKAEVLKSMLTTVLAHVPIRWGLTGTIPLEDFNFMALKVSIGDVKGEVTARELQERGVLSHCHVNILQLKDHAEYSNFQSEHKYLVTDPERLAYIGKVCTKIVESGNMLVLVDRIAAGQLLEQEIPGSIFISGGTKDDERLEHYKSIHTEDNKTIIATYGIAAVGINVPRIYNLVLLEPGKSFVRVIQSIGRGIRKAKDKDYVDIWDITSDCKYAKRHLTQRKKFYKRQEYPFTIEKVSWK